MMSLVIHETQPMRGRAGDGIEEHIGASVDEALDDLLGTPVVEAFHAYLLDIGVSRNDLPTKVNLLCSALDSTFEDSSITIQRAIARRLFAKLGLDFVPIEGVGLPEYLREARRIKG
jgi:hypothetical protein